MNNNLIGTVTALATIVVGLLVQYAGCDEATGTCTAAWLTPTMAVWAAVLFTGINVVLKLFRPGGPIAGLFYKSAVIVAPAEAGPGVVTEKQVEAPK